MSIAEQVEMKKLTERVAELERKLELLTSAWATGDKRDTLHLKDKKHG